MKFDPTKDALPEHVRFKAWHVKDNNWSRGRIEAGDFWSLAAYSVEAQTKRLSKENKRRLMELMADDMPVNKYIPDLGFKTPYRYSRTSNDRFVYIVDSATRPQQDKDNTGRETIYVRKVKTMPDNYRTKWVAGQGTSRADKAESFDMIIRYDTVKAVFKDRLTKQDLQKIDLLNLMEEREYCEGVGIWRERVYDYMMEKSRKEYVLDCLKTDD